MWRTITVIFLVHCLNFSPCRAFEIEDCGSKVGKIVSVNLSCDKTKEACDLIVNTNGTIGIDFTIDKDVTNVTAVVHGIIMDIPIPFPLNDAYACESPDSGLKCPLSKGGPYHYKTTLPVYKSYPRLSLKVKWQLKDESQEDIICILIPAKIKS